jgi:proteic killer suppression protein
VIQSFANPASADIYNGISSRDSRRIPQTIWSVARRKMDMINAAHELRDLTAPPANRLEALKGDRKGFHSIRINDQFRVVFRWSDSNAYEVEVVDYH